LRTSGLILENICVVFLSSSCSIQRNGQKRDNKNRREKTTGADRGILFLNFFGKKFLTWTSPKKFVYGVFELPVLKNLQKRHKKSQNVS
jgi:hypothetical protein